MLDSPAYRAALLSPTDWSTKNLARFKNMIRTIARITVSRGEGRGTALGVVRIRPTLGTEDELRETIREKLDPEQFDGVISMHLIESDPILSKPLADDPPGFRSRCRRLVCIGGCHKCERCLHRHSSALHWTGGIRERNTDNDG